MGSDEGHVDKERPSTVALADVARYFVGKEERFVALVIDGYAVALKIFATLIGEGREKTYLGVQVTIEMLESTVIGMICHLCMAEMPFADHSGLISVHQK